MKIIDVDYKEFVDKVFNDRNLNGGNKKRPLKFLKFSFKTFIFFILIGVFLTSVYSVDQTEFAILTTFGVPSRVVDSGLQFKLPFGIQQVKKISKKTFSTTFGYKNVNNSKGYIANENETKMITGDENIILADLEVQWKIVDPIAYLYNNKDQDILITHMISSSLRNTIGSSTVDEALTDGRNKIIEKIKASLIKLVSEYNLGISIVNVNLQDIDLPNETVDKAFKNVTDAREERITKINEANKYKNQKLNELEGQKSAILSKAEAQRTVLIQEAKADIANFNALYKQYEKYPNITSRDMVINTLDEIYSNAKIIIVDGNSLNHMSIDQFLGKE